MPPATTSSNMAHKCAVTSGALSGMGSYRSRRHRCMLARSGRGGCRSCLEFGACRSNALPFSVPRLPRFHISGHPIEGEAFSVHSALGVIIIKSHIDAAMMLAGGGNEPNPCFWVRIVLVIAKERCRPQPADPRGSTWPRKDLLSSLKFSEKAPSRVHFSAPCFFSSTRASRSASSPMLLPHSMPISMLSRVILGSVAMSRWPVSLA
jgi:hypothetical protein